MGANMRFSISHLIGTIGVLFLFGAAICLGGDADAFIDIPSFMITIGGTCCLLFFSFGRDFLSFIPASLLALFMKPKEPNPKFAEIATEGVKYAVGCGLLGTLIGWIQMLRGLDDPSKIGVGMAVALLTLLYGVGAVTFFLFPMVKTFSPSVTETRGPLDIAKEIIAPIHAVFFSFLIIASFCFLLISLGTSSHDEHSQNSSYDIDVVTTSNGGEALFRGLNGNVKGTDGKRFFRFDAALKFDDPFLSSCFHPKSDYNPLGMGMRIRAALIDVASSSTMKDLLSQEGKEKMGDNMKTKLNELLAKKKVSGKVTEVYFPSFIVQ